MADASEKRTRIIAVAVDHSEWSEQAFECEYKSYLSFHAAGVCIKSAAVRTKCLKTDEPLCFDGLMLELLFDFCGSKNCKCRLT